LGQDWIDLAWVMPAVVRELERGGDGLDDWLRLFDIENIQRHNAVSDAYATAKLLQVALAQGVQFELRSPADLIKVEKARRWKRQAG
jgi:DNA polymerase-3 subunit epsilon